MKKIFIFIISFIIVITVITPLFVPYIPGTADGLAHKFRLEAFHEALNEGYLRPRWLGSLALGFGAPLVLFVYNLPYYIVGLIHRLGYSINLSAQIYASVTLALSFLSMFLLGRKLWGNIGGLVAGTVYTWAPYHLMTVYLYEGWGEMGGFIFPPLILYLTIKLNVIARSKYQNDEAIPLRPKIMSFYWIMGLLLPMSIGIAMTYLTLVIVWFLFILTHNISVLMFTPVLILFAFLYAWPDIRVFGKLFLAFLTGALLSSFYTIPAIFLTGQINYYKLLDDAVIHRKEFYKPLSELIVSSFALLTRDQAHYLDFSLGLPMLLVGVMGVIWVIREIRVRKKKPGEEVFLILYILFLLSIFLINPASGFIWNTGIFSWIVYPFRFLFVTTFAGSLLAGYFARKNVFMAVVFIITAFLSGRAYTRPYADIFPWDDSYFQQVQTISVAPATKKNMAVAEFLPKWADVNFLNLQEKEYLQSKKPLPKFILDKEDGEVLEIKIRSENIKATLDMKKSSNLVLNTFYFPNWEAKIDGRNINVEKDQNGRIQLAIPQGRHNLEISFGYSMVEKIGIIFSIIGIAILFGYHFL